VLDLACGYGIVGIFLKKRRKEINICFTDDNKTATSYTKKNLEANNVQNYAIKNKNCLDGFKNMKFDTIVSNPPTHQGKQVTNEIFQQSYNSLNQGGKFYIVYNQNMRYGEKLQKKFSEVEILENQDNFYVVEAIK